MKNCRTSFSIVTTIACISLLTACAGVDQAPTAKSTPVQQVAPGIAKAATPAAGSSPTAASASAVAPGPTRMSVKPTPQPTTARPAPVKVPGAAPGEMVVTITGQVWDVAASARVIDLVEPVHGITGVAVDDKTEITSADGKQLGLQDVKPGVVIQASGQADGNGAVLANKIRILTGPSPLPAARPTPN